jgi:replicative DNA helicase
MKEKLLPSNEKAEQELLANLFYNPERLIPKVAALLKPSHFYRNCHAIAYEELLQLYTREPHCSLTSIYDHFMHNARFLEAGGQKILPEIMEGIGIARGNVEEYAQIIIRKATHRRLIEASAEIAGMAYEEEDEALERAQQLVFEIALGAETHTTSTLDEAISRYMTNLEQRRDDRLKGVTHGLSTGFENLDRMFDGGYSKSTLNTLAAMTGYGKTALALNIALNVVLNSKHALFFSLEMDESELVQRVLSMETEIDQGMFKSAYLDDGQMRAIKARARKLQQCDLKIDDRTYNISGIVSKAKREHARKPLDLIVVDYVQLMESATDGRKHETRAEEVAKLSRQLKRLAHELQVPVLALAQVNRKVEERAVQEPMLSDLNESGGIARDSDSVMFIWATKEELEQREQGKPFGVICKIAKHRNGRIGNAYLQFAPRITRFRDA